MRKTKQCKLAGLQVDIGKPFDKRTIGATAAEEFSDRQFGETLSSSFDFGDHQPHMKHPFPPNRTYEHIKYPSNRGLAGVRCIMYTWQRPTIGV